MSYELKLRSKRNLYVYCKSAKWIFLLKIKKKSFTEDIEILNTNIKNIRNLMKYLNKTLHKWKEFLNHSTTTTITITTKTTL